MVPVEVNEYFNFGKGHIQPARWRKYWKILRLADAAYDIKINRILIGLLKQIKKVPPQKILIAAVQVPGRKNELNHVFKQILTPTHHKIDVAVVPMAPIGKFDNINVAVKQHNIFLYDWLLIIDDDIALPSNFVNFLIYFSFQFNLKLSQPAHRFLSYASFSVTERHWASLARRTAFVEIGPVSLMHRDTFSELLPFPSLRWAWGLDIYWADVAKKREWTIGVIDAVPVRHLRPVGASYNGQDAQDEAIKFLTDRNVSIGRRDMFHESCRLA